MILPITKNFSFLIVFPHSNFALFNLFFFSITVKYFRRVVLLVYLFVSLKINLYWIGTKKISPVPTSILCLGLFFFRAQLNQFIVQAYQRICLQRAIHKLRLQDLDPIPHRSMYLLFNVNFIEIA